MEATECKGKPPESPLAEITREGPLWSKIAMYDGKVGTYIFCLF